MRLTKTKLLPILLAITILPWWSGGREPAAFMISFGALLLAGFIAWRLPKSVGTGLNVLTLSGLGLVAVSGLSLIWSVNHYQSMVWLVQLTLAVIAFVVARQVQSQDKDRQLFLRLYVAAATLFSLYGLWLYLAAYYDRVTSTFYWANPFAGYLLPAVIMASWWAAEEGKWGDRVMAGVLMTALILTQSRGALLAGGLIALIVAVLVRRSAKFWLRWVPLVVIAIIASRGLLYTRVNLIKHPVNASETARFAEALKGESQSVSDRVNYVRSSLAIWRDHPVGGTGGGTFATVYPKYQASVVSAVTNAHNAYVQLLAELGLLGLLGLAGIVVGLIAGIRRSLRETPVLLPVVLGLAALGIHTGLDIDASYPANLFLLAILTGMLYQPVTKKAGRAAGLLIVPLLLLIMPVMSLYTSQVNAQRGQWAQDDHDYELAAQFYQRAHSGVLYNPDTLTAEGINYFTQAQLKIRPTENLLLALDRANNAIRLDPDDGQHYFLKARVLRAQVLVAEALAQYREALKRDPLNSPEYYLDLATLELANGETQQTVLLTTSAINLYPEKVISNRAQISSDLRQIVSELYLTRALAHSKRGQAEEARLDIEQALAFNPDNQAAKALNGSR